jgi:hypothetical protein
MRRSTALRRCVAGLLATVTLPGCISNAGMLIAQGLPSYNESAALAVNQQLLLNLVRLRYRDTPFFLELGTLSAQQTMSVNATLGGGVSALPAAPVGSVNSGLGATVSATPTAIFTPLQGEAFVRRLLAPISVTAVMALAQSGWSVSRVISLLVEQVGPLENASSASGPTPETAPTFESFRGFARDLRALQIAGALQFGVAISTAPGASSPPAIAFTETPGTRDAAARVRTALGLTAGSGVLPLLTDAGLEPPQGGVRVRTRSLLGALFLLSHAVRPPERHVRGGLVTVTHRANGAPFDWNDALGGLMRIESSTSEPTDAFVRVQYRGHWFFLRDNDLESKSTFMLLSEVFSMQAGGSNAMAPALTLPLGR